MSSKKINQKGGSPFAGVKICCKNGINWNFTVKRGYGRCIRRTESVITRYKRFNRRCCR